MSKVVVNDHDVQLWANNANGPIAPILEAVARDIVIPDAQEALGTAYVHGELNPPPGPPRRRTGDLFNSLEVIEAVLAANLSSNSRLTVYVAATAQHRGLDYPLWLRSGGHPSGEPYVFLPDRSYYTYVEQT